MPRDLTTFDVPTTTKPSNFAVWLATRHYGLFMRDGEGGCMSGTRSLPRRTEYEIVSALCATRPDEWSVDRYTMKHTRTGTEIWTGNGRGFVRIYESREGRFRLRVGSQRRLWRHLHRVRHALENTSDRGASLKSALTSP